ncbi:hypothetical protein RN629_14765 [Sphingomonadaceae bacterium jetA1]|uniref:hypothetical protein n=1 Tax=Facivitalis istanbulensis TaxID=3075838 RepID=UPI00346A509A
MTDDRSPGPVPPSVSYGQTARNGSAPESHAADILVTGRRGAADMPPETELPPNEIDALGAYDIGEVLYRVAQTKALGSDPVVIVNGQSVADPSVFSRFPPDALVRVEILPREAGAQYGGDPARRVINIVLQRHFKSRDGQI